MEFTLYTYDWLPEFPRGFVRDIRVRWVAGETGRPYRVATVPVQPKSGAHRAMQPFAQVPVIEDGGLTLFESGAIVLHLASGTPLLPEARRAEITQWLIAALNSLEPQAMECARARLAALAPEVFGPPSSPELTAWLRKAAAGRLAALEQVMTGRTWIAGDFSAADILLADVLRLCQAEELLDGCPALTAYVERATARPAFGKAMADHMAHWVAADESRAATETFAKEN